MMNIFQFLLNVLQTCQQITVGVTSKPPTILGAALLRSRRRPFRLVSCTEDSFRFILNCETIPKGSIAPFPGKPQPSPVDGAVLAVTVGDVVGVDVTVALSGTTTSPAKAVC